MNFKHIASTALVATGLLLLGGCAKNPDTEANAAAKRYFDAWMKVNYPNAAATGIGIYIVEETAGTGNAYNSEDYVMLQYSIRDLDGIISDSNTEALAKQLGSYDKTHYYGPAVFQVSAEYAGLEASLSGMRIGGRRKVVVPGWLMSIARYTSAAEYLQHETGLENAIYDIQLCDFASDINKWEVDSIVGYVAKYMEGIDSTYVGGDTTAHKYGFYYQLLRESPDTVTIRPDSTFYINYTGRLLNGQVFDTTIADTAKVHGIYDASRTYAPVSCTKGEKYTEVKINVEASTTSSASTVINGFGGAIFLMQPYEKARTVFYSPLGYKTTQQGIIPPYSPLRFDIELVDNPNQ